MLNTGKLAGKTLYITGASRGIGKAIALKAAKDGANVVVAAKTAEPHPKLSGTIFTAAKERSDSGSWYLDLKNGGGACGQGSPPNSPADVTFTLQDSDFQDMFQGKLKPTAAFMSGKLKLKGDMSKAMSLDKLMGKLHSRGYHTTSTRGLHTGTQNLSDYDNVPEVFDRIKAVANADIVKKIDATYCFDIEGEGKYYVDLKNGEGAVSKGEPTETADVTISISQANILKLFNREIKPAAAFMTGQLKLSGDLSKAMALEAVMKASRGEKSYHTSAALHRSADAPPAMYESVPQVFERIKGVASEDIVGKVQAIYLFDVEQEGKFFVDFKNGSGEVGKGEPSSKADVTITMNTTNFLKIFNRELSPATAFMTGQIKVSGDLSKALTLEKVMKAAREAAEANSK